jgi:DNA-binding MurR/RpiR family transcriptional regulator
VSTTITDRDALTRAVTNKIGSLSEAQRRIALFVLNHYARVPFMTTTELAQAAGSSQSSVTRFVLGLGFDSFSAFTGALSQIVLSEINETVPAQRFARAQGAAQLGDLIDAEIRHLQGLQQILRSEAFAQCAHRISEAPRTVVAGFGAAASIAVHVHLYLSRIQSGVSCVTELTSPIITESVHLKAGDCAIMFAVPRYINDAITLMQLLADRGVHLLLVTDRGGTDLVPSANDIMVVPITNGPTTAFPAAMLTLGGLLVEAVALLKPERTMTHLQIFETLATSSTLFAPHPALIKPDWEAQLETYTADPIP